MSKHKQSHLKRYLHLADVLARHGLGYFSSVLALERFVPLRHGRRADGGENGDGKPQHVRMALEEMGAAAIKVGQILSTRADLVPPEYHAELSKLQDAAPPVPGSQIREVIEAELGRPIGEIFACFDEEPLAAASVGQVHAARLHDGTEVVVKVRRPGVLEQIEEDLEIFHDLALAACRRWEAAEQYDVVGLADEFAETLRTELDYIREGHSAERIAANFADVPCVHIPKIFWETTTSQVLTMERVGGLKIDDLAGLEAAGIDRVELANLSTDVLLKMVFEDGFYHADPHPGNLFIQPDGTIAFIDFGMVGTVDDSTRKRTVNLLAAMASKDVERLVDAFLDLGSARQHVDRAALGRDLQYLENKYMGSTLQEIHVGAFLNESLAVVRRYHLQMPRSLALILRMAVVVEGGGAKLDPGFSLMTRLEPYGEKLKQEHYSLPAMAERLGRAGLDALELGTELPVPLRRLMKELESGNLQIAARPTGIEPWMERLEVLANRIVLGLLASAFIVSLAVLTIVFHPPGWQQWAGVVFGFAFIVACGLGVYLAWSVTHPKRR